MPFLNNPVFDTLAKVLDAVGVGFTAELAETLKGNWAVMSQADAERMMIRSGDAIRIGSDCGVITVEVRPSADIAPGVVAVHQHWGHTYDSGMTTARRYPGVNVNRVHSDGARDRLCGMPLYNGTPVSIERA